MSTATAQILGNLTFERDDADKASFVTVLDEERDQLILAKAVARISAANARTARPVVVELKPRNFAETAAHFLSVVTPVEWPIDEHDID
jgi:hypothetical protein